MRGYDLDVTMYDSDYGMDVTMYLVCIPRDYYMSFRMYYRVRR